MNKINLVIIIMIISKTISFGQNDTIASSSIFEPSMNSYKHSIGASLFMLINLSEESADYGLLTYGYQISGKDRVFIEYNTWKYSEPMGNYGNSEEFYPGFIRTHGIGVGYQHFHWKGLFNTIQATNFLTQYHNENDEKTQKGYQLYLQFATGYRLEFFKKRFYLEPGIVLKYWPIDTNAPSDFEAITKGTPKTIWEPCLNFGFKF